MSSIVLYCPGEAPGSPAYLEREKAEGQLRQDMDYCQTMERATGKTYQLPHINGGCTICVQKFGGYPTERAST